MNNKEFTAKWGLFTSCSELSEEETLAMEQLMEADPVLQAEVAEDHQLHRLLQSMGAIHSTQDDFVSEVMAACNGVDNPVTPLLENDEANTRWQWKVLVAGATGTFLLAGLIAVCSLLYSELNSTRRQVDLAMQKASEAQKQAEHAASLAEQRLDEVQPEANEAAEANEPVIAEEIAAAPDMSETAIAALVGSEQCVWAGKPPGRNLIRG